MSTHRRPARLKILGKTFKLTYETRGADKPLKEDEYGECDLENQHIRVLEGQPLDSEQDSVLHEVLHAVDGATVDETDTADEKIIRRIATGLLAVIKDNPRFLSYLRLNEKANGQP